jgi:putative transposase
MNRLQRLSRSLSRKVKGSNNRNKAKERLSRLHAPDTIRVQTLEALSNPKHPYRIALNEQFGKEK